MQRSTHCVIVSSKMNRPHLNSIDDEEYIDCFAPTYDKIQQPNDANTEDYTIMDHHQQGSIEQDKNDEKPQINIMDCIPKDINFPNAKQSVWSTPFIVITVLLFIILIVMVAILCMMVAHIASNRTSPDFNELADGVSQNTLQLFQNTNFTELDKKILQITRDSAEKLSNIVNTLSNLQDTSTSTAGVVDDILLIAQELLILHNNSTALHTSCKEIKERQPLSPSGVYLLANNNATYTAYCNMDELCGSGEGWTRLAYLDMSDATQNCPSGFRLYQSGGVRACGRTNISGASCVSVQFPSNGISYSQICGRVTGYQFGSTDAVYHATSSYRSEINSFYVDGVSITRGSPRQHVWTLMAGYSEASSSISGSCPCNTGSSVSVQSFIGDNYYCESGNHDAIYWFPVLYTSDPLWDGQGCGSLESPCCNVTGIPWFHRDYGSTTTTDYIELRVCADERTANEDSPVSYYEIYVK